MKRPYYFLFFVIIYLFASCQPIKEEDEYLCPYFNGVSNYGKTKQKPYLTAGDKMYIIGTQNGLFPDIGGHVQGEMGGVWMHPIKLADGFWLKISEDAVPDGVWLMEADEYITYPHGNKFIYRNIFKDLEITRFQFVPDQEKGAIINYTFRNNSTEARNINLDFLLKTDISPVWLSRENGIEDYPDLLSWDKDNNLFTASDSIHNWHMAWGTNSPILSFKEHPNVPIETLGQGKNGLIYTAVKIMPGQEKVISFAISGSTASVEEAISINRGLLKWEDDKKEAKKSSFREILGKSRISIPDKELETTYNWVKINTRWLEMDLDGYGRFLGAGAIEYPWLFGCDNSYALQGVLATGGFDLAKSTLSVLKNVSEKVNGNGRIIHEMSTNGFIYNKGNTQETAHFIMAVWKAFEWTGDIEFLSSLYPYVKLGIEWLTVNQDTNANLFPEGYGIMEVVGLNVELIDVSVYTQQALVAASKMASIFNEKSLSEAYYQKSERLKEKINLEFWDDTSNCYCDFYGTRDQAISVAQGAIEQLRLSSIFGNKEKNEKIIGYYNSLITEFAQLPENTTKGWFTNKNWVINTPLETGIAPNKRAIKSLDIIRAEHCGEHGPYLSAVEKGHMMTISTGVQAMSEAQYGRTDDCLWYMKTIVETLSRTLPGSINEIMPEYGCPVQAWTIYGIATPIVTHIFGVHPDAYNKTVIIAPHLPSDWKFAEIKNQWVGSNSYDIKIKRDETSIQYTIHSKLNDWNNKLRIRGLTGKEFLLNNTKTVALTDEIHLSGTKNSVIIPTP
jgi:glycogen debranching enzyme